MAATQVQVIGEGKGVAPNTQEVDYPLSPTQGNLLVCIANIDDFYTAVMVSAGWTKIDQSGSGSAGSGGLAMFWKIAGEGEPTEVSLDYGEANRRGGMILYEYSNPVALSLDQFVATYDAVANNVATTGETPALSSDAVLAIAALSLDNDNANLAGTSWTDTMRDSSRWRRAPASWRRPPTRWSSSQGFTTVSPTAPSLSRSSQT